MEKFGVVVTMGGSAGVDDQDGKGHGKLSFTMHTPILGPGSTTKLFLLLHTCHQPEMNLTLLHVPNTFTCTRRAYEIHPYR